MSLLPSIGEFYQYSSEWAGVVARVCSHRSPVRDPG